MRSREDNAIFTNIPIEDIKFYEQINDELEKENQQLKERIDKANNELIILIQIIGEQPSNNVNEDNYLLSRLESISSILKGDSNEN